MATAYLENAEADLSCSLCMELFVDPNTPKQLDCPHVFCQKCLTELVKGGVRVIVCPDCRGKTKVPPKTKASKGGVAVLKTSIRLRSLAENHLKHSEKVKALKKDEDIGVAACPKHDGEKLHFYCVTCKVLVCQACGFIDHDRSTHTIEGVKQFHTEIVAKAREKTENACEMEKEIEVTISNISRFETQVQKSAAATEADIDEAVADVITKVQQQGETLKVHLEDLHEKQLVELRHLKEDLSKQYISLNNSTEEIDQMKVQQTTPYECVAKLDQIEELFKKIDVDEIRDRISNSELQTTTIHEFVSEPVGELGRLMPVTSPGVTASSPPDVSRCVGLLRKVIKTKIIESIDVKRSNFVVGRGHVLAIWKAQDDVNIYHKQVTGEYKHICTLHVCKKPGDGMGAYDVAITDDGRFMVAHEPSNNIKLFSPDGHPEGIVWSVEDITKSGVGGLFDYRKVQAITVLSDGRVVVAEMDEEHSCSLTLFSKLTCDGHTISSLDKTIDLDHVPCDLTGVSKSKVAWISGCKICLWDVDSGGEVRTVHAPGASCLCYDEMADSLMVGFSTMRTGRPTEIKQYQVSSLKLLQPLRTNIVYLECQSMAFIGTNDLLVAGIGGTLPKMVPLVLTVKLEPVRNY